MYIMQGDQYAIPIHITCDDVDVTPDVISTAEITVGRITKTYPDGGVSYANGNFLYNLTQQEAFDLSPYGAEVQVRVKLNGGEVIGVSLGTVDVIAAVSKAVL